MRKLSRPFGETFTCPSPPAGADPTKNTRCASRNARRASSIASYVFPILPPGRRFACRRPRSKARSFSDCGFERGSRPGRLVALAHRGVVDALGHEARLLGGAPAIDIRADPAHAGVARVHGEGELDQVARDREPAVAREALRA